MFSVIDRTKYVSSTGIATVRVVLKISEGTAGLEENKRSL